MPEIISQAAIGRRLRWVNTVRQFSGHFGDDAQRLSTALSDEFSVGGNPAILDHLRLCGDIPESYGHDSSEEKLYSKYTDSLISESFKSIGLRSVVLDGRGDAADVEACSIKYHYCFVADAKSFRLSRTAKNQKDFKIQALDGWRRDKEYAMVVCPIYQLPARSSQIYKQASARSVCIFTYSHLAVLVAFSSVAGRASAQKVLHEIFKVVPALNPSKDASAYWLCVNRTLLSFSKAIGEIWQAEKIAAAESMAVAKQEALDHLAAERTKVLRMSRDEAVKELMRVRNIDGKIRIINSIQDNFIFDVR